MTSVALHQIVVDDEIYPRATWSQTTVDRYADAMQAGEMFPPIILESGTNRLLDGMHRTEAFRAVGRDLVPVDYHEVPDGIPAKLYAASLSSRHGDPLAADDKRQVAREIAERNPDYSVVLIAKFLGASRQTVGKYIGDIAERRREVRKAKAQLLKRSGMSMQQIADELSVGKATAVEDVNADISDRLTEAVLREAAADLPIDAGPLVAEILAERTRPNPSPGPSDAELSPSVDPGQAPAPAGHPPDGDPSPREPDPSPDEPLIAAVLDALAGHGQLGRSVAEVWTKMPGGVRSATVQLAVDELVRRGRVTAGPVIRGTSRWLLTPEPAAPSTAHPGSGQGEEAAPVREGPGAAAEPEQPAPATPPPGSPATWTDEQREAHRREVDRKRMVAAGQRAARDLVMSVRAEISTVVSAIDLGEKDLINEQVIADLRAAVDLLESRLEANR